MKSEDRKYKIYVNDSPLILVHTSKWKKTYLQQEGQGIALMWMPRAKTIFNVVDNLMKGSQDFVILYGPQPKLILDFIRNTYRHMVACGGVVKLSGTDQILMMFRRGHWDLPKGKQDPGEKKKETAIREVQEETGLVKVEMGEKLGKTYHLFVGRSGRKIIKTSHWYAMTTNQSEVIPQVEEDIEELEWVPLENAPLKTPIYANILDILARYSALQT